MRPEVIASPILRGSDGPGFPGNIPGLLILKGSVPVSQKIRVGKRSGIFFQVTKQDISDSAYENILLYRCGRNNLQDWDSHQLYYEDPTRCNSMQVFIYCKITLHISGVHRTHHQEYIKL